LQLAGVELGELARGGNSSRRGERLAPSPQLARAIAPGARGGEKAVGGWSRCAIHLLAAETLGRRERWRRRDRSGTGGVVELRLDHPLAAHARDRLVLRRPSPASTLGGGEVLDPFGTAGAVSSVTTAIAALGGSTRRRAAI
jgi:selenocysteine-specific elongation factor